MAVRQFIESFPSVGCSAFSDYTQTSGSASLSGGEKNTREKRKEKKDGMRRGEKRKCDLISAVPIT